MQISFYKNLGMYKVTIQDDSNKKRPIQDKTWMAQELMRRHQKRQVK